MLPVILVTKIRSFLVCGLGKVALGRVRQLEEAGVRNLKVYAPEPCEVLRDVGGVIVGKPKKEDVENAVMFVAGLSEEESEVLAKAARAFGALVNVEDKPALCDFHMPSIVRRGDLLFTVSTGGRSPALARCLKKDIAAHYGAEWELRLDEIAQKRATWRNMGLRPSEVGRRSEAWMNQKGWIK